MVNVNLNRVKRDYENGVLKESDMTIEEKQMLINWYENRCRDFLNKIKTKKSRLYNVYINMKKIK